MNQEQNNFNSDNQFIQNNNDINNKENFSKDIGVNKQPINNYDEIKISKQLRKSLVLSKISLTIFSIILLISLNAMIEFNKDNSGMSILIIIISIFLLGLPFFVSLSLFFSASNTTKKYIKEGIKIPGNIKKWRKANKILIFLIVLIFVGGIGLKDIRKNIFIKQKLSELYNTNYKVLKKCSTANEGGDDYEEVIIGLENFEYPIYTKFDWAYDDYKDNYENLKRADRLNYQSYIKSIFDDKALSLLNLEEEYDDYYDEIKKYFDLNILLTSDYLKDEGILKTKIKEIYNKYVTQFPDYLISISLYFTENINDELKQEYYMVISDYGCHDGYKMKDGSSISTANTAMTIIFNNLEYYTVDETIDNGINHWHYLLERESKN